MKKILKITGVAKGEVSGGKITIRPRGSWVLIRPEGAQKTNEAGLVVPDSVEREKKSKGVIIDVGPLVEDLKKGQTVMYSMYAGEEVQFGHREFVKDQIDYILVLAEDILAIIE